MNDGMAYALVTFTIVPLVLGGYLAYLVRRARAAQQDFGRDMGRELRAKQDESASRLPEPGESGDKQF